MAVIRATGTTHAFSISGSQHIGAAESLLGQKAGSATETGTGTTKYNGTILQRAIGAETSTTAICAAFETRTSSGIEKCIRSSTCSYCV